MIFISIYTPQHSTVQVSTWTFSIGGTTLVYMKTKNLLLLLLVRGLGGTGKTTLSRGISSLGPPEAHLKVALTWITQEEEFRHFRAHTYVG